MPLNPQSQLVVAEFFDSIKPFELGFKATTFSYLAIRQGADFAIVAGRIALRSVRIDQQYGSFRSENVRAGRFRLSDLGAISPGDLLGKLCDGRIKTPDGDLVLPTNQSDPIAAFIPFHQEGLNAQTKLSVLSIRAPLQDQLISQPKHDWEVKAASAPFDGLTELAAEYGTGVFSLDSFVLEVVALEIAAIDTSSTVAGTKARLAINLAKGLDSNKATLGYRVLSQNKVPIRQSLTGDRLTWREQDEFLQGTADIDVPQGAVVHCIATYAGSAQNYRWVADPLVVQNPRRAVHEAFDRDLEVLRDNLTKSSAKGRDARDLESGVAWLLWMAGFSVTHLGGTERTQDAADLLAVSPLGHFAVIECTTGILKAENKLPLLVQRTEVVRRRLRESGNQHLRVLPIIVTSKSREDVRGDLEQAERLGIGVLTSEGLSELLERTVVLPNADDLFSRAEQSVQQAQARYEEIALRAAGGAA